MTPDPLATPSAQVNPPGGLSMLLGFPVLVIAVTLAIALVGAAETWAAVALAVLAVAGLTGLVAVVTARFLADEG